MAYTERRGGRKKRRRQRRLVRRALEQILESEEADEASADAGNLISRDEIEKAGQAGLIDPANLEIFLVWYVMGGDRHRTITIQDAIAMPAAMRHDFGYIFGELAKLRRRRRKRKDAERERSAKP